LRNSESLGKLRPAHRVPSFAPIGTRKERIDAFSSGEGACLGTSDEYGTVGAAMKCFSHTCFDQGGLGNRIARARGGRHRYARQVADAPENRP